VAGPWYINSTCHGEEWMSYCAALAMAELQYRGALVKDVAGSVALATGLHTAEEVSNCGS
jgi:hypothetical protein